MADFPILSLSIWVPIVFGILVLATGDDRNASLARWLSLFGSLAGFLLTLPLFTRFNRADGGFQFQEYCDWIPNFHIHYHLGIDGIAALLIQIGRASCRAR